jgi:hypothetical protein
MYKDSSLKQVVRKVYTSLIAKVVTVLDINRIRETDTR